MILPFPKTSFEQMHTVFRAIVLRAEETPAPAPVPAPLYQPLITVVYAVSAVLLQSELVIDWHKILNP